MFKTFSVIGKYSTEGSRVFKTPIWVTGPYWSDSAQLDNFLQHPMIVDVSSTQISLHGLGWLDEQVFRHFSQECRAELLNPRRSVYKSVDLTTTPCSLKLDIKNTGDCLTKEIKIKMFLRCHVEIFTRYVQEYLTKRTLRCL